MVALRGYMNDAIKRAVELKRSGNYAQAIALFEEAIELEGPSPFLLSNLGHSFLLSGNLKEARVVLEEAIARDPRSTFARIFLAGVAEREGRGKDQIELLSEVIDISPEDVFGRVKLIWAMIKCRRSDHALPHAQWLAANVKDNVGAFRAVAAVFRALNRKDDAKEFLKKAISISPNDAGVVKDLLELGDGEKDDKLREIECLLKLPANRKNRDLFMSRIRILEKMNDVEGAISSAREVSSIFPEDQRIRNTFAHLLVRAKKYAEAISILGELLCVNPRDYYLHNAILSAAKA